MSQDPEALREELAAAFAEREPIRDDALLDPNTHGDEAAEAEKWLRGKTWQQVLSEGMGLQHRDLLHWLSPEAWLYYFPAFATIGLEPGHPAEMPETLPLKLAWWPHTVKPLVTRAQRRAIAHVLEYWADAWDRSPAGENVARYALRTHWSAEEEPAEGSEAPAVRHDPRSLQDEIQAAFSHREPPAKALAGGEGDWLRGKSWQDLLAEGVGVEQGHKITPLSAEAWLYYFPAFASLALEPDHSGRLQDALLVKLTWFPNELEPLLTPAERRAIVHFLEAWSDRYQSGLYDRDLPRYALTIHWGKRSDSAAEPTPFPASNAGSAETIHQENDNALS